MLICMFPLRPKRISVIGKNGSIENVGGVSLKYYIGVTICGLIFFTTGSTEILSAFAGRQVVKLCCPPWLKFNSPYIFN
jgi:hypothetical protein